MVGSRFRFKERERVALLKDRPELEILAGDPGVIEGYYEIEPPAYEVSFQSRDGQRFGMICFEQELTDIAQPAFAG